RLLDFTDITPSNLYTLSLHDALPILTNPAMFTGLKWDQQRAVLMQLISGLTDQDVIKENPELKDLSHLIADSTIEDQNKRINDRSEEHTSELQSRFDLVCRLLLEKKK